MSPKANVGQLSEGCLGLIATNEEAEAPNHRPAERSGWNPHPGSRVPKFVCFSHRNSLPSGALEFHFLQVHSSPWGLVGGAGHCQQHPAGSARGTPSLKPVILGDILSSPPHMAAPSVPSPGDWAHRQGRLCQRQGAAGPRILICSFLPRTPPHTVACSVHSVFVTGWFSARSLSDGSELGPLLHLILEKRASSVTPGIKKKACVPPLQGALGSHYPTEELLAAQEGHGCCHLGMDGR